MRLGYILGISLQTELLLLSFFGILFTIFDASLLEFSSNMTKIWDMHLDPELFTERSGVCVKYILSGVLLVRTFTIHIYLGTYIIMLYPLLFEDRPGLIIPWMAINILKCHITGFVAVLTGLYICIMYKFMKPSCWEFLLSDTADYMPSLYMFSLVLRFYHELNKFLKIAMYIDPIELRARRRRTRLIAETNAHDNRSLDGMTLKRKEMPRVPTVQNHVSLSPVDMNTINQDVGPNWQEANNVTVFSMRDAVVSGRSFKVSGTVLEVHGQEMQSDQNAEKHTKGIDTMERVQRIDDLDENQPAYQAPDVTSHHASVTKTKVGGRKEKVAASPTPAANEYNTVSDLLNDPDIAIVLDMIAGKDDPFRTDLSLVEKYDIRVEHEDPMWAFASNTVTHIPPPPPPPKKRGMVFPTSREQAAKPETQDATNQVRSPKFEEVMDRLAKVSSVINSLPNVGEAVHHVGVGEEFPNENVQQKEHKRVIVDTPPVNQIYKNRAAYPRTYKDDGYTQAYEERMLRRKEAQAQKQSN